MITHTGNSIFVLALYDLKNLSIHINDPLVERERDRIETNSYTQTKADLNRCGLGMPFAHLPWRAVPGTNTHGYSTTDI
ncbi:MAG TPA: hypothetical protein VN843_28080 [Anaerolineales bacterium]|nr:hypothetical protein [Anaerolineales bacterium]